MSAVAVDTSVLLAIFNGEPRDAAWLECLRENAEKGNSADFAGRAGGSAVVFPVGQIFLAYRNQGGHGR